MYYGVARLELLITQSRSLKEKRAVLHRIRDRLESRFRVSVSEVDHQDLWQRAALGVAVVAQTMESARNALQAVRREAESDPRVLVAGFAVLVDRFEADDLSGLAAFGGFEAGGPSGTPDLEDDLERKYDEEPDGGGAPGPDPGRRGGEAGRGGGDA